MEAVFPPLKVASKEAPMPIVVRCVCGKEYHFKDEYTGRRAKCPAFARRQGWDDARVNS